MKTILLGIFFLASVAGMFFIGGGMDFGASKRVVLQASPNPRIEVISPTIYIEGVDGIRMIAKTGDKVAIPSTIFSSANGNARLYFPDGSVMRIDQNSELLINDATYDETNGALVMRAVLIVGRVWSKILNLATPEARWEVETSNAVAVVRGTAFSTGITKTSILEIIGSENTVTVFFKDQRTDARREHGSLVLSGPGLISATNEAIAAHIDGTRAIMVQEISPELAKSTWVSENEALDHGYDVLIRELRDQGFSGTRLGSEMFLRAIKRFERVIPTDPMVQENSDTAVPDISGTHEQNIVDKDTPVQTKVESAAKPASDDRATPPPSSMPNDNDVENTDEVNNTAAISNVLQAQTIPAGGQQEERDESSNAATSSTILESDTHEAAPTSTQGASLSESNIATSVPVTASAQNEISQERNLQNDASHETQKSEADASFSTRSTAP